MGMFYKCLWKWKSIGLFFSYRWSNWSLKFQQLESQVVSLAKSHGIIPYLFQILHQAPFPECQVLVYFQKYYSHWYLCRILEGQKSEYTVL